MKPYPILSLVPFLLLATAAPAAPDAPSSDGIPRLERHGTASRLVVDGKPFLIVGGELLNSSSSSREHMRSEWERVASTPLNTVLTPVSWDMIEPEEGHFDFSLVDGLISDARPHNLHLVLLWLASWKNGMSCYAPIWVKRDFERFPRVPGADGSGRELLSTLGEASRDADAAAFAALMRHLRSVDGSDHTVLMVQVENEVGILGDSRDRSAAADRAFAGQVPGDLLGYLREHKGSLAPELRGVLNAAGARDSGTWAQVFGSGPAADEIFMAWNYARYVGAVAAAGKTEYPIPLYANAWLRQPYFPLPGTYPSGGPQAGLIDVWRAAAPAIDIFAPDLYGPDFRDWCAKYARNGNPLFLPETESGKPGAAHVFYALGQWGALGFSPFGIDRPLDLFGPKMGPELGRSYSVVLQLSPLILEHQGMGEMTGFLLDKDHPTASAEIGGYRLDIALDSIFGHSAEEGHGLVIATGPGEFVGAGTGFMVRFTPESAGPPLAGLGRVEEGTYEEGAWVPGRRLNGDETDQGQHWRFPFWATGIQRCTVYRYR
jgi:beta-galactosidase GanA